jgi:hypothetical protein
MNRRSGLAVVCGLFVLLGGTSVALAQQSVPPLFRPPAQPHLPSRRSPPAHLPEDDAGDDASETLETAWEIVSNFATCVDDGGTVDECLARTLLCDLIPMAASSYFEHVGGAFTTFLIDELQIFGAFRTRSCDGNCFWCCLTPTGCHSSFGPSPVINCNARYGLGTHTLGYTLFTSNPTGTDACLAIPQTCDLYSQCAIAGSRGYPGGLPSPPPQSAAPSLSFGGYYTPEPSTTVTILDAGVGSPDGGLDPNWTPPRGVRELQPRANTPRDVLDAIADRKVRMFAESVARTIPEVLDSIPPDQALDELSDLFSMRGCVGHRTLLAHGEPFDGTHGVFGVNVMNPRARERVSTRRALHFLATLRVLGSIPNLRNRLIHVESRVWTATERAEYLRGGGVVDADRALRETMSGLALRVLQRVDGVQDYRLLAVPLPDEGPRERRYNGCRLGTAPQVTVSAHEEGNEVVLDVSATETDAVDARIRTLPLAIEWGDDTTSRGTLPTATLRGSFRHTYRRAGRYAAVVAVAGQSGLHGLSGVVFEAAHGDPAAPRVIGFERVTFPNLQVFATGAGNRAPGSVTASLTLVQGTHTRRIGRAPTRAIEVRQTMTVNGVETVTRPGFTSLGDLIGYNTGRTPGHHLDLRVGLREASAWDGRSIELRLRDLRFDLFSAQRGVGVVHGVALTPSMLRVYYGTPPMQATASSMVEPDGTVRIPLVMAGSSNARMPFLDHIEIDVEPLLARADLGTDSLSGTPVGVRRRWSEVRPGVLVAGAVEGLPDTDGSGCGCRAGTRRGGGLPGILALLGLAALRRSRSARRTRVLAVDSQPTR